MSSSKPQPKTGLPVLENRQPLPDITLEEMLTAFRSVVMRANLNQHHNIQREALSVRERMSNLLALLNERGEVEFLSLFSIEEGRAGCVVSFLIGSTSVMIQIPIPNTHKITLNR